MKVKVILFDVDNVYDIDPMDVNKIVFEEVENAHGACCKTTPVDVLLAVLRAQGCGGILNGNR